MTIHTLPFATASLPTLSLRRELDRLFDDVFVGRPSAAGASTSAAGWQPATDAREDDTGFTLTLDLPGVSPESVEVLAEDGVLTVKGARVAPAAAEGVRAVFTERAHGAFLRRFRLPKSADLQAIDASYSHGVLTLRVGKVAPAQPRRVPVSVQG